MITVESFKFVGANFRGLSIFYRFVGLVGWGLFILFWSSCRLFYLFIGINAVSAICQIYNDGQTKLIQSKEGSTKFVYVTTQLTQVLALECGHISHTIFLYNFFNSLYIQCGTKGNHIKTNRFQWSSLRTVKLAPVAERLAGDMSLPVLTTRECFTYMETSQLPVKGFKFGPIHSIHGHRATLQRATPTFTPGFHL